MSLSKYSILNIKKYFNVYRIIKVIINCRKLRWFVIFFVKEIKKHTEYISIGKLKLKIVCSAIMFIKLNTRSTNQPN